MLPGGTLKTPVLKERGGFGFSCAWRASSLCLAVYVSSPLTKAFLYLLISVRSAESERLLHPLLVMVLKISPLFSSLTDRETEPNQYCQKKPETGNSKTRNSSGAGHPGEAGEGQNTCRSRIHVPFPLYWPELSHDNFLFQEKLKMS